MISACRLCVTQNILKTEKRTLQLVAGCAFRFLFTEVRYGGSLICQKFPWPRSLSRYGSVMSDPGPRISPPSASRSRNRSGSSRRHPVRSLQSAWSFQFFSFQIVFQWGGEEHFDNVTGFTGPFFRYSSSVGSGLRLRPRMRPVSSRAATGSRLSPSSTILRRGSRRTAAIADTAP